MALDVRLWTDCHAYPEGGCDVAGVGAASPHERFTVLLNGMSETVVVTATSRGANGLTWEAMDERRYLERYQIEVADDA